jgi:hypothetical protein
MLEFLIDNIFVSFGGTLFQQVVGIPMGTNCAPIIATDPCIANQLRDVNTICRRSWYIAAHVWKIYDFNIEVVPLIINFSTVSFGGTLFQQVVGIPMGTNCAPLLADLFLYSYESEFLQCLVKD